MRIPLAQRDLRNIPVLPQVINQLVGKRLLTKDRSPPHFMPDGLADAPIDKLPVFLLCLSRLPSELTNHPVRGETRMRRFSPRCRPVAAPLPCLWSFHHLCRNGVSKDLGVKPIARIKAVKRSGCQPAVMEMSPVPAVRRLLNCHDLSLSGIDVIEINEAFAAQYLCCEREMDLNRDLFNVNGSGGGGVSLAVVPERL